MEQLLIDLAASILAILVPGPPTPHKNTLPTESVLDASASTALPTLQAQMPRCRCRAARAPFETRANSFDGTSIDLLAAGFPNIPPSHLKNSRVNIDDSAYIALSTKHNVLNLRGHPLTEPNVIKNPSFHMHKPAIAISHKHSEGECPSSFLHFVASLESVCLFPCLAHCTQ